MTVARRPPYQFGRFDAPSTGADITYACKHGVGIRFAKVGGPGKVLVHAWHIEVHCAQGCVLQLVSPSAPPPAGEPVELPDGSIEVRVDG